MLPVPARVTLLSPAAVPLAQGRGLGPPRPAGRAGVHGGCLPGSGEGDHHPVLCADQTGGLHRLRKEGERGLDQREEALTDRGEPGLSEEKPAVGPCDPAL